MRRTSWDATGLLEPVWKTLGVSDGRDELARLTGIPATSLSSVNTGKRPLTLDAARRISEATGVALSELGAEAEESPIARLESLVAETEAGRQAVIASLASIDVRLSRIEERLGIEVLGGTEVTGRAGRA